MDEIEIKTLKQQEKAFAADGTASLPHKPPAKSAAGNRVGVMLGLALITIGLFALVLPLWQPAGQPVAWQQFWWLIFLVKPLFYGFGRVGGCRKPSL